MTSVEKAKTRRPRWATASQAAGIALAAPFGAGAVSLWWKLAHLPSMAGHLARAQILGAALFSFGVALGLIGATFTLTAVAAHRRVLCMALTLFGLSHVIFGLYVRHAIEATATNSEPPVLPLLIPVALWAYSVVLAFRAPKLAAAQKAKAAEQEIREEQPQLLSRP